MEIIRLRWSPLNLTFQIERLNILNLTFKHVIVPQITSATMRLSVKNQESKDKLTDKETRKSMLELLCFETTKREDHLDNVMRPILKLCATNYLPVNQFHVFSIISF
jgi:hypothetical protein